MNARRALVAVLVVAAAYAATPVFLPAFVALVLAVLVSPAAAWLRRWGAGRGWAAFLGVALALGVMLLAAWGGERAIAGVVRLVPQYAQQIRREAQTLRGRLERLQRHTATAISTQAPQEPSKGQEGGGQRDWTSLLLRGLGSLFEAAGLAIFVPFLALFLLLEEPTLEAALDRAAGPSYDAPRLRRESAGAIRAYVFGNFALGLAMALAQWALFAAVGLGNAVGLGLVTGYLNVIPVLGLPLALLLPLAQGLASFHAAWQFVVTAGVLLAIHLTAANWVIPRTIATRVKVNATAGTLGMLFFGWLWGVVGFLLAVPLTALVKICLECSPDTAALGGLLAAEPPAPRRLPRLRLWRRHGAVAGT